jgi:hypothetical protein
MDESQIGINFNIDIAVGRQSVACYTLFQSGPKTEARWAASNLNATFAWIPVARTERRLHSGTYRQGYATSK